MLWSEYSANKPNIVGSSPAYSCFRRYIPSLPSYEWVPGPYDLGIRGTVVMPTLYTVGCETDVPCSYQISPILLCLLKALAECKIFYYATMNIVIEDV